MNISSKHQLIGIAGSLASGKDTVSHHLEKDFEFHHVSLGDMVREVAQRERGSIERPVLYEVANNHRQRDGAGYFVQQALEKPRPLIVSGFRTLGEAKAFKEAGGILLFLDAPIELRYQRMKSRRRDLETELTLEGFKQNEAKEWYAGDGDADFNLGGIKEMSDIVINNSAPLDEFIKTVYQKLSIINS